eukprot:CAMPEP_0170500858 /NCGR_PEP_ID=MMETSP0208-20121228/36323_1 /TAXON_ID=197538 /ORGANISM="Strombidium inclinatum, Strain S3" /LENGTH=157 /DNA_ID=CAMNT_0010779095 /DNA_START=1774 /DNA_END=2246 /DNA_ORIENTATION=-
MLDLVDLVLFQRLLQPRVLVGSQLLSSVCLYCLAQFGARGGFRSVISLVGGSEIEDAAGTESLGDEDPGEDEVQLRKQARRSGVDHGEVGSGDGEVADDEVEHTSVRRSATEGSEAQGICPELSNASMAHGDGQTSLAGGIEGYELLHSGTDALLEG